jgi:hypothetical protein
MQVRLAIMPFQQVIAAMAGQWRVAQAQQAAISDKIVDQRGPTQRHPLPQQHGLQHDLIIVESQFLLSLGRSHAHAGEPVVPAEPAPGPGTAQMQQPQRARSSGANGRLRPAT